MIGDANPGALRAPHDVVVVGAPGRLGTLACDVIEADPELRLAARFDSGDDWSEALQPGWLAFEATRAGLGHLHARRMLERGVRPVIATSGVEPKQLAELDALARQLGLGGRVVPNLSLGAWLLERALALAARSQASSSSTATKISITETHHVRKRDAPSGTAKHLARMVEEHTGRAPDICSLRQEDAYAEHVVRLESPGESLVFEHRMDDPAPFGEGIRFGLKLAATDRGMQLGLPWEQRQP